MNAPTDLNDYHKQRNKRLIKKVSEQPPMSREESIEQIRRLQEQSQRHAENATR